MRLSEREKIIRVVQNLMDSPALKMSTFGPLVMVAKSTISQALAALTDEKAQEIIANLRQLLEDDFPA